MSDRYKCDVDKVEDDDEHMLRNEHGFENVPKEASINITKEVNCGFQRMYQGEFILRCSNKKDCPLKVKID